MGWVGYKHKIWGGGGGGGGKKKRGGGDNETEGADNPLKTVESTNNFIFVCHLCYKN